jgi:RecB family endonuclease NucS
VCCLLANCRNSQRRKKAISAENSRKIGPHSVVVIDLLVFHKNFRYTTVPLRYKYSVVELKKDIAQPKDVGQLIRYSQWASGRLANGEAEMIQPILIAYDFSEDTVKKAATTDFNDRGILLFKYSTKNQEIIFEKINVE